jgi:dihydroflavonol-4-reductase
MQVMNMIEQSRFWKGRSVGLTGGTGFVGHHVAMLLRDCGAEVTALVRPGSAHARLLAAGVQLLEGDLCRPEALEQLCTGKEFVFHIAGAVSFESDWKQIREINVECARQMAAAARRAGIRRLVHTSSVVAIGAARRPVVIDEAADWNLAHLQVPYVTTKWEGEQAVLADGVDVVVLNPTCVVGPDDFSGSEFGTLCRRFWKGRIPFHFGGGNNFVDVRDVAIGHLLAGSIGKSRRRYILGGHDLTYHS